MNRLGLATFDVFGAFDAGPVAVAYAARHPERVSRLILWCSWARSSDIRSPRIMAWLGLLDQDWELMTDTCAHLALGWPAGETGRHAAQRLRESVTPEAASRWSEKHPEATILRAEEAFRLGRLIAEGLLDVSRLAEPTDAERERTGRVDER